MGCDTTLNAPIFVKKLKTFQKYRLEKVGEGLDPSVIALLKIFEIEIYKDLSRLILGDKKAKDFLEEYRSMIAV